MPTPNRTASTAELIRLLPAKLAAGIHTDLMAAEARLTDAMDALDMTTHDRVADALQWLRDDVKTLRRAAMDAALS